jgi:uncharacterized protein (DUF2237 family)
VTDFIIEHGTQCIADCDYLAAVGAGVAPEVDLAANHAQLDA